MIKNLSAIELACVVKELKDLEGSKVEKVYQPNKSKFLISLHKTGEGKKLIKIVVGEAMYLGVVKGKQGTPSNFCMLLRKRLNNSFLASISQKGFERIVELKLQNKKTDYYLIIEFFSKGNIVLCDKDKVIVATLMQQIWKDRKVQKGEKYIYPSRKNVDLLDLNIDDLKHIIKNSTKSSLVTMLALDLGLGGLYAEEVCARAEVDKEKKKISDEEIKRLFSVIKDLVKLDIKANICDTVVPFEMETFKESEKKYFDSFNDALRSYFSIMENKEKKTKVEKNYEDEVEKLNEILETQKEHIKELEKSSIEDKERGDLIYKNYAIIEGLIKDIKEKKWNVKSKIIKELKPNEGKVVVELE